MDELELEIQAISTLVNVLKPLDATTRVHVLDFVLKRLGIELSDTSISHVTQPYASAPPQNEPASSTPPHLGIRDIRTFAAEKNPKTVNEKVAVICYYLGYVASQPERREYITSDDIKTYFIQAGFQLPTAPARMTLTHAKNAGYLNTQGTGQYKLNSVGYNLVAHKLPANETSEPKKRKQPRKRSKPKATKKAKK